MPLSKKSGKALAPQPPIATPLLAACEWVCAEKGMLTDQTSIQWSATQLRYVKFIVLLIILSYIDIHMLWTGILVAYLPTNTDVLMVLMVSTKQLLLLLYHYHKNEMMYVLP